MVRALALTFFLLLSGPSLRTFAQDTSNPAPPPKPRPDDHNNKAFGERPRPDGDRPRPDNNDRPRPDGDRDHDHDHDRPRPDGDRDHRPDGGGGGDRRYGFPGGGPTDSLNEDEKKQLRTAMDKVWNEPEIVASRERIMKANEDLRTALRTALQKTDPDVVKILEKVKNVMPWEQHRGGPPRLPRPEDPNFPRMATARLGMEMMFMAKPEQRDALRHLHERVISLPPVKDAIAKIEAAPVEGRMDAFKTLRDIYKKECEREIAEYRAKHKDSKGPESSLDLRNDSLAPIASPPPPPTPATPRQN